MAGKYLGEFDEKIFLPDLQQRQVWALNYIESYGGIDGGHHKDWVLDQVARILNGCKIKTCVAKWDCGTEDLRFSVVDESKSYISWVKDLKNGEDGPETYGYDIGIPP